MVIKCAAVQTRRKAIPMLKELCFSREPRLQPRLQARPDEETRIPESLVCNFVWNFVQTMFTKKAISRVLGLGLEQALRRWKANSKIYKVMFHKVQLILMFDRSKRAIKRSQQNSSSAISSGRDCRQACVKKHFLIVFFMPRPDGTVPIRTPRTYNSFKWIETAF